MGATYDTHSINAPPPLILSHLPAFFDETSLRNLIAQYQVPEDVSVQCAVENDIYTERGLGVATVTFSGPSSVAAGDTARRIQAAINGLDLNGSKIVVQFETDVQLPPTIFIRHRPPTTRFLLYHSCLHARSTKARHHKHIRHTATIGARHLHERIRMAAPLLIRTETPDAVPLPSLTHTLQWDAEQATERAVERKGTEVTIVTEVPRKHTIAGGDRLPLKKEDIPVVLLRRLLENERDQDITLVRCEHLRPQHPHEETVVRLPEIVESNRKGARQLPQSHISNWRIWNQGS
ncbi:hypothetical protein HDV00_003250 [Rhizophlyctis rosea]|nr:hypothetical protein HDV00_003250 [Rhizophlyctis rosea]